MPNLDIVAIRLIGSYKEDRSLVEAVIRCKLCTLEYGIQFTQRACGIHTHYMAEDIARAYVNRTQSGICGRPTCRV